MDEKHNLIACASQFDPLVSKIIAVKQKLISKLSAEQFKPDKHRIWYKITTDILVCSFMLIILIMLT